jgi:hypothetical protein
VRGRVFHDNETSEKSSSTSSTGGSDVHEKESAIIPRQKGPHSHSLHTHSMAALYVHAPVRCSSRTSCPPAGPPAPRRPPPQRESPSQSG